MFGYAVIEFLTFNLDLLVSQLTPVYPAGQLHMYPLTPSMQIPPLRHGLEAHSSISETKVSLFVYLFN